MARCVADSSAILAVVYKEPGREAALPYIDKACVSANIVAEVFSKLLERGFSVSQATNIVTGFEFDIHPVDTEAAWAIGEMRLATRSAGLSLGDRSCLELARKLGLPALTADSEWMKIADAVAVEVILIR